MLHSVCAKTHNAIYHNVASRRISLVISDLNGDITFSSTFTIVTSDDCESVTNHNVTRNAVAFSALCWMWRCDIKNWNEREFGINFYVHNTWKHPLPSEELAHRVIPDLIREPVVFRHVVCMRVFPSGSRIKSGMTATDCLDWKRVYSLRILIPNSL